jgi:hypothetical protein
MKKHRKGSKYYVWNVVMEIKGLRSLRGALFVWLIRHQPAVLFSQNKPATSNQAAVLFSQNKPAPTISHQPTEQSAYKLRLKKGVMT